MTGFNKKVSFKNRAFATGWLPPLPDLRDYTENHNEIKPLNKLLGVSLAKRKQETSVDLRKWCSPVKDQGSLGSCAALAGAGIIEYYENRAFGRYSEASGLFLYKVTRNLMQVTGDTGAWIRYTMGALALCGIPAEKYWPYVEDNFDVEPPAFVYSLADNYEALKYFRHDPLGRGQGAEGMEQNKNRSLARTKPPAPGSQPPASASENKVLISVKKYLQSGIPSMFGFWGFQSYDQSDTNGAIPYPADGEHAQWGHAVVAVGYDDNKKIKNLVDCRETTGALLIRNCWGKEWGDEGYGWLPYDYVLNDFALDFWSLLRMEWIETGQFGV